METLLYYMVQNAFGYPEPFRRGSRVHCDRDGRNSNSTLERRVLKTNGRGGIPGFVDISCLVWYTHCRCTNRLFRFTLAAHAHVWQAFLFCICPILFC